MRASFVIIFIVLGTTAWSQRLDSLVAPLDTIKIDSTVLTPVLSSSDSLPKTPPPRRSDVETTINYNSKDSIRFNAQSQEVFMYGETYIDYGEITLEAERTEVDWERRTIHASYVTDTTGKEIGKPVYTDGPDIYATDDIIYNFNTKRALIKGVVTQQDDAYMHGDDVKKNSKDELFIRGASYTTCNLAHPHFEIKSTKLKVIPGNKVVSGPFNMRFRDLPTPLFFPFGMFPQPKEKVSGIIFPSYGEENRRGFFLRDGGYYLAINDNLDARITGDIYSKGGNAINFTSNYFKRYSYRGTVNFSYTKSVTDDIENPIETNDYWLRLNLSPLSQGNSSISASVSAGTSSYNSNNNLINQDFSRSINSQFASNISYRNSLPRTPFNMSLNLRHSQNLQTEIVSLTLPDFTLNMNRIYPFKNVVKSSKSPLSKLNFSHNFISRYEINNGPINDSFAFTVANSDPRADSTLVFNSENFSAILDRSKVGGQHSVPISTSMTVLKYFTLSPSFNYRELWYTKELSYEPLEDGTVRIDTVDGFSRAGSWTSGASLNTRVYGTVFFKKGKIQAIRHVMTPSVSFSYNPDFSDPRFGVYKEVPIDDEGNTTTVSKYQGFIFGSPTGSESKTMGFSLSNNIEMKVASKKDTITGSKKIKIFDNLGISSGYNFAAEEFKLNNINLSARTSFFNSKVSVNFTGTIDPYEYRLNSVTINSDGSRTVDQDRIDRYAWNNGNGLGNLSNMNVSLGINLRPKSASGNRANDQGNYGETGAFQQGTGVVPPGDDINFEGYTPEEREEIDRIQNNPNEYIDFNIPWTLRMQYSINRTQRGFADADVRQSFQFSGSLGLTEKTQITFNSGYDFEAKDFTTTRVGITRDLHCWSMNFDWVPFGRFQSYFFSIRVQSQTLKDLKWDKRRSFFDFFN